MALAKNNKKKRIKTKRIQSTEALAYAYLYR
jgi:hypothetical protein